MSTTPSPHSTSAPHRCAESGAASTDAAPSRIQAGFHNSYGGALDAGNTPIGGNSDTVMVAEAPFFDGDHAATNASASEVSRYRTAIAFDDDGVPKATVGFALGAREDADDPHARDQQAAGLHAPLAFRREDVEAAATERLLLRAAH